SPPYIYTLSLHDALPIYPVTFVNQYTESNIFLRFGAFYASAQCCSYLQNNLAHDPSVSCIIVIFLLIVIRMVLLLPHIYYLFYRSEEHTSELQSRENLVC